MSHITGLEPVHHRPSTCECLVITWTGTVLTKKLGREFIIINIDMFSMATWHVSKWRKEFISLVALEASTHEPEQWRSWPAVQKLSFVHWSGNIIILTKFSTLAAPKLSKLWNYYLDDQDCAAVDAVYMVFHGSHLHKIVCKLDYIFY